MDRDQDGERSGWKEIKMDRDQMEWDKDGQDGQDGQGSRWMKTKMEGQYGERSRWTGI
jgi:hypothetical protein